MVNLLKAGDDVGLGELIKLIGHESYHPTAEGHQLVASKILETIPSLMSYDYCQEFIGVSDPVCPIMNPRVPNPSSYWGDYRTFGSVTKQHHMTLANDDVTYAPGDTIDIELGDYSFASNSDVTIEVHSTPTRLATVQSAGYGSLSTQITLPVTLQDGFHTIHLFGQTYAGQSIDIYDVIGVAKPDVAGQPSPQQPSSTPPTPSTTESKPSDQVNPAGPADSTDSAGVVIAQQGNTTDANLEASVLGEADSLTQSRDDRPLNQDGGIWN